MSIEPTCHFCNYSDKFRCTNKKEADTCSRYLNQQNYRADTIFPYRRFIISTKPNGDISVKREGSKKAVLTLHPDEAKALSAALRKL